jgi:hypothetical protein
MAVQGWWQGVFVPDVYYKGVFAPGVGVRGASGCMCPITGGVTCRCGGFGCCSGCTWLMACVRPESFLWAMDDARAYVLNFAILISNCECLLLAYWVDTLVQDMG